MAKRRRRKKGKKPGGFSLNTLAQQQTQREKKRMLSILNFDETIREQVEDMFDINLEGLSPGQEPMFFSTAIFEVDNSESVMAKLEQLADVDLSDEDEDGAYYVWTRAYPKGHWNPMSTRPEARQIIGDISVNFDDTLKLGTRTKGWMTGLIYYMMDVLGKEIKLISLDFQNPLDMLKDD